MDLGIAFDVGWEIVGDDMTTPFVAVNGVEFFGVELG